FPFRNRRLGKGRNTRRDEPQPVAESPPALRRTVRTPRIRVLLCRGEETPSSRRPRRDGRRPPGGSPAARETPGLNQGVPAHGRAHGGRQGLRRRADREPARVPFGPLGGRRWPLPGGPRPLSQ